LGYASNRKEIAAEQFGRISPQFYIEDFETFGYPIAPLHV
jgi:hypothetical protein